MASTGKPPVTVKVNDEERVRLEALLADPG